MTGGAGIGCIKMVLWWFFGAEKVVVAIHGLIGIAATSLLRQMEVGCMVVAVDVAAVLKKKKKNRLK